MTSTTAEQGPSGAGSTNRPVPGSPRRSAFVNLLLAAAAVLSVACLLYAFVGALASTTPIGRHIGVSDINPQAGEAFIARLSDPNLSSDKAPSPALLYLVEAHRGGVINRLQDYFPDSYLLRYLGSLWLQKFPTDTYETWRPLGPSNQLHDDIRNHGGGRYSVWKGYVYFSLPVGKQLRLGDHLDLIIPAYDPAKLQTIFRAIRAILAPIILIASGFLALGAMYLLLPLAARSGVIAIAARNTAPGLIISCVLVLILAAGGEIYLRATTPFTTKDVKWPIHFDPAYGWLFQPGAEVRWTNGLDFWSTQRANSLGFLDREPVIPKPPGTFRIALVGDSFVEAAQLPLEQKQQTVLAKLLNHGSVEGKYDVVALGYSGTGQSNELAFFEKYKDLLQPDLVILEFINNDFSNNSALLEAIRNGWGVDHPPRLFLIPDGSSQGFHRMPIDPDWSKYSVPGDDYVERAQYLRKTSPIYNEQLGDWNPQLTYIDYEFYENRLPPAFQQALAATKFSFSEFKRHSQQDGFKLVVVATDGVTFPRFGDREFNQIRWLKSMLQELDIPLLDLYPKFTARGGTEKTHFAHDGHWNATGDRWAAEEMYDFLKQNRLLDPDGRQAQQPLRRHVAQ